MPRGCCYQAAGTLLQPSHRKTNLPETVGALLCLKDQGSMRLTPVQEKKGLCQLLQGFPISWPIAGGGGKLGLGEGKGNPFLRALGGAPLSVIRVG